MLVKAYAFMSEGSVGGAQGQAMRLHVVNMGLLGDHRPDLGCSTALMPIINGVTFAPCVIQTAG